MILAVNGTLMRGFELHPRLLALGGTFISAACTTAEYRLWSIGNRYPGMIRDLTDGHSIAVELYEISADALVKVVEQEPPGLCLGKIMLQEGRSVLGILAEPWVISGGLEITESGGWPAYMKRYTHEVE